MFLLFNHYKSEDKKKKTLQLILQGLLFCGSNRSRTYDPLLVRQML